MTGAEWSGRKRVLRGVDPEFERPRVLVGVEKPEKEKNWGENPMDQREREIEKRSRNHRGGGQSWWARGRQTSGV